MRIRVGGTIAALLTGLLAAACGTPTNGKARSDATTTTSTTAPGGDPSQLVLRITTGGGFVAPASQFAVFPAVSVYADGTVITVGATTMEYPGRALPPLRRGSLAAGELRDILAAARDAGVRDPGPDLGQPAIADAPSTAFFVRDGSGSTTVHAYALVEAGNQPGLTASQVDNRNKLIAFAARAQRLGDRTTESYTARSLAVLVGPYPAAAPGDIKPEDLTWTGSDLGTRPAVAQFGERCIAVEGAELATMAPTIQAARSNARWHSGAKAYALTFRPQLPDERPCAT
jgi:hypothetical protein